MVYTIRLLRKYKLMLTSSVQNLYDTSFNLSLTKTSVAP